MRRRSLFVIRKEKGESSEEEGEKRKERSEVGDRCRYA